MWWMMISLFGLVVVDRIFAIMMSMQLISAKFAQVFRIFFLFLQILINILLRQYIFLLMFVLFLTLLAPNLIAWFVQTRRERIFCAQIISMLDAWIITMRSGKALRLAQLQFSEKASRPVQYLLNEYITAVQYQQNVANLSQNRQMRHFFQELEQIERQSHKSVERLKALRRKLMMEKFFRQKSRQATLQVKFQSLIISVMYLGLLVYVQHSFGISSHLALVMSSSCLFIFGLVWAQKIGSSYKWKI